MIDCFRQQNFQYFHVFVRYFNNNSVKAMCAILNFFPVRWQRGGACQFTQFFAPVFIYPKRKQQFVFFIWWQTRARAIRDFCLYICRQRQVYRKQFLYCTTSLKVLSYFNKLKQDRIKDLFKFWLNTHKVDLTKSRNKQRKLKKSV